MQVLNAVSSMLVTGSQAVESIFGAINEGALALNELAQKGHKHAANLNSQTGIVLELNNIKFVAEIYREISKLIKKGANPDVMLLKLENSQLSQEEKAMFTRAIHDAANKHGQAKPQAPAQVPAPAPNYIM